MHLDLHFKNQEHIFNIHEEGTPYLSFRAIDDTGMFTNAFSTRLGGVSEGYLSTMNLTFRKAGEKREHVLENYRRLSEAAGFSMDHMVLSNQVHGTDIIEVGEEDIGKGVTREQDYESADGMVTDVPGLTLVTFYADCVPLYFADPVHKAIGLSHSGWRGTVRRIGQRTLSLMEKLYGSDPRDVICCIGPSICRDCFEVGPEVAEAFFEAYPEDWHADIVCGPVLSPSGEEKYHIDLWRANELMLLEAGARKDHIHVTNICTRCNPDILWSHRDAGPMRGNMAAFLSIKNDDRRM